MFLQKQTGLMCKEHFRLHERRVMHDLRCGSSLATTSHALRCTPIRQQAKIVALRISHASCNDAKAPVVSLRHNQTASTPLAQRTKEARENEDRPIRGIIELFVYLDLTQSRLTRG